MIMEVWFPNNFDSYCFLSQTSQYHTRDAELYFAFLKLLFSPIHTLSITLHCVIHNYIYFFTSQNTYK